MKKHIKSIVILVLFALTIFITREATIKNCEPVILGDLDNNKKLDYHDVFLMQQHILGIQELDKREKIIADIDFDGEITITDLALINRYIAR